MRKFQDQYGFLAIAQNNETTDYLTMAYYQAKNIKATQKNNKYAVIVDTYTNQLITENHKKVFDYVIQLPIDLAINESWKQANESQVFALTPFKETIKLEVDLLMPRSIDHWIYSLRNKNVCFSYHCNDYKGTVIKHSPYRLIFQQNSLPDIYTGMYYFRYTQEAANFFQLAKNIYSNWKEISQHLIKCDVGPSTDLVYALASKMLGEENFYIPTLDFFRFVHMKSKIQKWSDSQSWTDYVNIEQQDEIIRINNLNQYMPVHYYEKEFAIRSN